MEQDKKSRVINIQFRDVGLRSTPNSYIFDAILDVVFLGIFAVIFVANIITKMDLHNSKLFGLTGLGQTEASRTALRRQRDKGRLEREKQNRMGNIREEYKQQKFHKGEVHIQQIAIKENRNVQYKEKEFSNDQVNAQAIILGENRQEQHARQRFLNQQMRKQWTILQQNRKEQYPPYSQEYPFSGDRRGRVNLILKQNDIKENLTEDIRPFHPERLRQGMGFKKNANESH